MADFSELAMKRASFVDTVKTVLFGFLGVRKRAEHERMRLNPAYVIATAVIFVILFILTIRTIVRVVVGS